MVVGVPTGTRAYTAAHAQYVLQQDSGTQMLNHVVSPLDSQVTQSVLRLCHVTKATWLMRIVAPALLAPVLPRVEAPAKGVLPPVVQERCATASADEEEVHY